MSNIRTLLAAAALVALAGCAPKPSPPPVKAGSFERSQALIDSGNVAYRAGDYENAARRYASAAVARPDDPAAFYGLGMALAKLGRGDDARVAYAKARALAGTPVPDSVATGVRSAP